MNQSITDLPITPVPTVFLSSDPLTRSGCDCLVNPWHTNRFPAVFTRQSRAARQIREAAGIGPFRQLARHGRIPLGECLTTGAGQMKRTGNIIHVAVANEWGKTSLKTIADAAANLFIIIRRLGPRTVALPLMGVDFAPLDPAAVAGILLQAFSRFGADIQQLVLAVDDPLQFEKIGAANTAASDTIDRDAEPSPENCHALFPPVPEPALAAG